MKKLLTSAVFAASALALMSTEASAWYCRATSSSASGWATRGWVDAAKRAALNQCAIRTPRDQTCYIRYCR